MRTRHLSWVERTSLRCRILVFCILFSCFSSSLSSVAAQSVPYETPSEQRAFQSSHAACPSRFCGRSSFQDTALRVDMSSSCQSCPRGEQSDGFVCIPCGTTMKAYDALFLVFEIFIVAWFSCFLCRPKIESYTYVTESQEADIWLTWLFTFVFEPGIAATLTVAWMTKGSFSFHACSPRTLRDWYPIFYERASSLSTECTSEAAYPLYSFFFVYIFMLLLVCIPLSWIFSKLHSIPSCIQNGFIYLLYLVPILAIIHAVLAGLLYYSFPFLMYLGTLLFDIIYDVEENDRSSSSGFYIGLSFSYMESFLAISGSIAFSGSLGGGYIAAAILLPFAYVIFRYMLTRSKIY